MTKLNMPEVFHEALALHMILQAGGVSSENIFVVSTQGKLAVVVIENDVQVYGAAVGDLDMSEEDFRKRWPKAVQQIKTMSNVEAKDFRDTAKVRDHAVQVFAAVHFGREEAKKLATGRMMS